MKIKRLPNELPHQYAALCSFAHLGPKRSLREVAEKLEIPVLTLRGWSGRYRWGSRVDEYDLALCAEERRPDPPDPFEAEAHAKLRTLIRKVYAIAESPAEIAGRSHSAPTAQ